MASKVGTDRLNPINTVPPPISTSDKLLACRIALPSKPCVVYALFRPFISADSTLSPHDAIELARRTVTSRYISAPLLDSVLLSVLSGINPVLYLFVLTHHDTIDVAAAHLAHFSFDGLALAQRSSFSFQESSSLLPDVSIRDVYSHFLGSVRSRVIDGIVEASSKDQPPMRRQFVKRYKDGFVLSQTSIPSDWASSWQYKSNLRPLIYFYIQIQLSFSKGILSYLVLHATPLPTPFLNLSHCLPISPGMPITLLPYGTPAYFLAKYGGPTTGLIKQFRDSLQGLGVGEWDSLREDDTFIPDLSRSEASHENRRSNQTPPFILGWIKVENKQGEDKGIIFIWPAHLCLSYTPTIQIRAPLDYIPELPSPLQPSPQVASSIPIGSTFHLPMSMHEDLSEVAGVPSLQRSLAPVAIQATSDSLHNFRDLTLSKSKDIRLAANEVGGYVDAIARERERERERLKRERESGINSSPKLIRTAANTPASAPTPMSIEATTSSNPSLTQTPQAIILSTSNPSLSTVQHHTVQNFYPSPPHINHPTGTQLSEGRTSPVAEPAPPLPTSDTSSATVAITSSSESSSQQPSSTSYDPFINMESTWSQPTDSYDMDMDMDFGMDMDMGFSMNINAGTAGSGVNYHDHHGGMDYDDAFTDDDFSFFDRPTRTNDLPPRVPSPLVSLTRNQDINASRLRCAPVPQIPMIPDMSPGDGNLSGPGPHSVLSNLMGWSPSGFIGDSTPRSLDMRDSQPPDLLPPSAGQSPESHSAPPTPSVQINFDQTARRPSTSGGYPPSLFEPIPFAPYHRAIDNKYSSGKFALLSPMSENDSVDVFSPMSMSPNGHSNWRTRYNSITDPRVAVVRKLIGVKRKSPFNHEGREKAEISSWLWAQEEWGQPDDDERTDHSPDAKSNEADSDDDDDLDDNESPSLSRPSTPPPAYLPLGPTLLHSHFHHSQLLPLSTPLRPPGSAVIPTNLSSAGHIASVPTPVSPAATLGAASEKSKSLESAAFAVAAEVVENPLWAETWRTHNAGIKHFPDVWPADIKAAAQLLEAVPFLEGPLQMASLFGVELSNKTCKGLELLEAPLFSVGKGDAVIQVLPPALRFWEKLGLGPRGRLKDLTVYALFEDDGGQRHSIIENWLCTVSAAYKARHMGSFTRGSGILSEDSILPIRFDTSFRKALVSFMSGINHPQSPVMIFMVIPVTVMTLASSVLRQVLSASKKALKNFTDGQIIFQLVPEPFVLEIEQSPRSETILDALCSSVYNRVHVSVERLMARRIHELSDPIRIPFQDPTFTLARPLYHKVTYARSARASLDVMDRFTLLHIAYHISPCRKWILASSVDQRGEAYDLRVWLTQSPGERDGEPELSDEAYAVAKVWDFALEFAKKADVEWRVVIAKLGPMAESEMDVWNSRITDVSDSTPSVHVGLVSVEPDAPWPVISSRPSITSPSRPPRSTSSTLKHHTIFTDVSATIYALVPSSTLTASLPSPSNAGFSLSFVSEPCLPTPSDPYMISNNSSTDIPLDAASTHPLPPMPRSTTTLIRVPCNPSITSITMLHIYLYNMFHLPGTSPYTPDDGTLLSDITRNYHELALLGTSRFHLNTNPILPFHLAAVETMRLSLDRDWDRIECPVET